MVINLGDVVRTSIVLGLIMSGLMCLGSIFLTFPDRLNVALWYMYIINASTPVQFNKVGSQQCVNYGRILGLNFII